VVSVLVIRPKIRGFKPGKDDGFLRALKFRHTTSFGWEIKLSVPCRKVLRHVKEPYEYERDTCR
jgi:hypothetical protein